MKEYFGVRFRPNGVIHFYEAEGLSAEVGDCVIMETKNGIDYGKIVLGKRELDENLIEKSNLKFVRMATENDTKKYNELDAKNKRAYDVCVEKIAARGLKMKLIEADYAFDNSKVLFYFTADKRIDFRELVKDLAAVFKTRIELRQIGVRDETKIVGGIGMCGRGLCCNTYLAEFVPVSIKMAKEQNLSLNPTKISGVCGRLMCCLNNEQETYEYLNSRLPNVGDIVKTATGEKGEVASVNVLRQTVKLIITDEEDNKEIIEYKINELRFKPKKKKRHDDKSGDDASLKQLEDLDKNEGKSKLND